MQLLFIVDINECVEHRSGCNQLCNNTVGGHFCTCFSGFRLSSNNRTCLGIMFILSVVYLYSVDINECDTGNGGCDHKCTNTDGSYTCSCNSDYELNSDSHTCNGLFYSYYIQCISILYRHQ